MTAKAGATRFFYISVSFAVTLISCGHYRDFHLPVLSGSGEQGHWSFVIGPEPTLLRGAPGSWDAVDVLNPSVVHHNNLYLNFYSGFDGKTWHTGLATSHDGTHWTKQHKVISPNPATWEGSAIAANGAALYSEGKLWYWYQAGNPNQPRLGLATSDDGKEWEKEPLPVLSGGPSGSWDERGVADPYVIEIGEWYYLYYLGQDRAHRQRLGLARSGDGIHWDKLKSNPIMDLSPPGSGGMDENGLGEPAVWASGGYYWLLFTGRNAQENRSLGLARSKDGVHWERLSNVFHGAQTWDAKVLCDPTVLKEHNHVRVWFGGGDVASPDQNLHGQIGEGILTYSAAAAATHP